MLGVRDRSATCVLAWTRALLLSLHGIFCIHDIIPHRKISLKLLRKNVYRAKATTHTCLSDVGLRVNFEKLPAQWFSIMSMFLYYYAPLAKWSIFPRGLCYPQSTTGLCSHQVYFPCWSMFPIGLCSHQVYANSPRSMFPSSLCSLPVYNALRSIFPSGRCSNLVYLPCTSMFPAGLSIFTSGLCLLFLYGMFPTGLHSVWSMFPTCLRSPQVYVPYGSMFPQVYVPYRAVFPIGPCSPQVYVPFDLCSLHVYVPYGSMFCMV